MAEYVYFNFYETNLFQNTNLKATFYKKKIQ